MTEPQYQLLPLESSAPSSSDTTTTTNVEHRTPHTGLRWRPSYLRRRVMCAFCAIFVLVIIALEALLALSDKNNGITTSRHDVHYLWTYGPTAFFTIIAATFSRVEFQSKMIAPWQRLAAKPVQADKALLLDYVSQLQPTAIYASLRNKDFAVATTITVYLIIKLLIIISTGLITLLPAQIRDNSIPVVLQDSFIDNTSALQGTNTLPYYTMRSLIAGDMTYPPGLSKDFAFQSFQSIQKDAEIQVTVDGFTSSLACEPANVVATRDWSADSMWLEIAVRSHGCNTNLTMAYPTHPDPSTARKETLFGRFVQGQCEGTSDETGKRVFVLFGHIVNFRLLKSTQLLCSPTYTITKVDLVQNDTVTRSVIPRLGSENRTMGHVSPWSIMHAHFNAYIDDESLTRVYKTGQTEVDVDAYTNLLYGSQNVLNVSQLDDRKYLERIATDYYRQSGAIIARRALMKSISIDTFGSATINVNRLFIQYWAVQWMVGLAAVSLALAFLTTFIIPTHAILPCSPHTFPGMAALVSSSHDLLAITQNAGDANKKNHSSTSKDHKHSVWIYSRVKFK